MTLFRYVKKKQPEQDCSFGYASTTLRHRKIPADMEKLPVLMNASLSARRKNVHVEVE